jgi:hypothetical protein
VGTHPLINIGVNKMQDSTVMYQNRAVPRDGFRVFIYNSDGDKKLVNSYEEYERHIKTGDWHPEQLLVSEPKRRGRTKKEG